LRLEDAIALAGGRADDDIADSTLAIRAH